MQIRDDERKSGTISREAKWSSLNACKCEAQGGRERRLVRKSQKDKSKKRRRGCQSAGTI